MSSGPSVATGVGRPNISSSAPSALTPPSGDSYSRMTEVSNGLQDHLGGRAHHRAAGHLEEPLAREVSRPRAEAREGPRRWRRLALRRIGQPRTDRADEDAGE